MLCDYKVVLVFVISVNLFPNSCWTLNNSIIELTDNDFDENTESQEWSLVIFVKQWCTRCKKMTKEFAKAAELMEEDDSKMLWAKVDCESDGVNTCNKFSISNVPALFLFKRGNYFKEFMSKPDFEGILRFIKIETGPGYTIISNPREHETFFKSREVKIVGNFKQSDSPLRTSLMNLVDEWKHHFDFGFISDSMLLNDDGIRLFRPNHLLNKFEPDNIKYSGSDNVDELRQWILKHKHGMVGHRHEYNINDFQEPLIVVYFNIDYKNSPKTSHYWRNRVLKVAQSYPEFTFAVSGIKKFQKEVVNFGYNFMRASITPIVCAYIDGKRFPMTDDFSVDAFSTFLVDLKKEKIKEHIRSEEIPESNDGPVKVAVAKNFNDVVNRNGRDTLIKFYATWCTWCKKLAPTWKKLAEAMKDEEVDIVKFNAEKNELPPGYKVNQYPTLFWAPKNSKGTPVVYEGGKDLQDFIRYIAQHSTDDLGGYDRNGNPKQKTPIDKEL